MKIARSNRWAWIALAAFGCGAILLWCCTTTTPRTGVAANAATSAATGTATGAAPVAGPAADLASLSLRLGLALALIVALVLAAGFVVRKALGARPGVLGTGRLHIVDRLDLAPKRALYGVRAGTRVVVVGVTETTIAPVFELSIEEAAALYPPGDTPRPTPFSSLLQIVTSRTGAS